MVQAHRPEIVHQIHAGPHRAGATDAQQHDLAIGRCGLHGDAERVRVVEVAARLDCALGRAVDMEGLAKCVAARALALTVEDGQRLRRLMLCHVEVTSACGRWRLDSRRDYICNRLGILCGRHELAVLTKAFERPHTLDNGHWLLRLLSIEDDEKCRSDTDNERLGA